ncbi:outer membrane beta-barrel protein [Mucilaginibacter sp. UR6-11]|uniref:outer membrane beta-barrel protein n=1 Tax=Mucilaginibacter sp. UR6-11 TaxID=1435644 RepID=UPI001E2BAD30|nr:outer membrane beta-barrel protein [Mucilaginibacter sp. UR6-11]MCC8425770.1 TonB-dependent receptor [Mucilaginibacter sp. UR6-11]
MKKLILTFFTICIAASIFAQAPKTLLIKGVVTDSVTNKPIGYATVALQSAKTQVAVKSILTSDDGSFELDVPSKIYRLVFANAGYQPKMLSLTDSVGAVAVGNIVLSPVTKQLAGVTITAAKPLMKREVDRISYDVQADPESKAVSALDMMRKVPLLSVDGNDAIKLKGNSNYKILVNGRESALVAKSPSDILKAMPATNVERIEVITTPPAKYDAEGLAGIINIITKKNADQGYNVGINGRMNTVWGPGININSTVKQGKFGMSAFGGFGQGGNINRKRESGSTQNFFSQQSTLSQSGINAFGGNYQYGNAELSYEIDSLNLLTASLEFYGNDFNQYNNQSSTLTNGSGGIDQGYSLANTGNGNEAGGGGAINYQLGFKNKKDRLLTLSYKYNYAPYNQFNDNLFSDRINYPTTSHPDFQQYNKAGNREHTIQLDYAHPFKKITIEAGAKGIMRNNFSNYHLDDKDYSTNTYITNPGQTNDFNYRQNVYSFYNSYQLKLDKWAAKAGLRLEHTTVDADFSSAGTTVKQDYNNFIPSISIQRNLKGSSLNLGFTQRIQRPVIYQLNPFVDQTNPKFISTGNAGLRPELNNSFEFTYSNFSKTPINIGLSYSFSNNSIQNVSGLQVNNVAGKLDTVTITTFQDLGSNNTLGLNLNTNLNITQKLTFNINAQLNHVWLKGQYNGQMYKNSGYTGNAFGGLVYKFDKGYRFNIDAGYYSGNVVLQGQSNAFIYSSYVMSKEFLNKTATISLVANNPYSKFRSFRSSTTTADYYQTSYNQNFYRTLAVRFNYKFGKLNSDIKKNKRGINNDDTRGGSGKSTGGGN